MVSVRFCRGQVNSEMKEHGYCVRKNSHFAIDVFGREIKGGFTRHDTYQEGYFCNGGFTQGLNIPQKDARKVEDSSGCYQITYE